MSNCQSCFEAGSANVFFFMRDVAIKNTILTKNNFVFVPTATIFLQLFHLFLLFKLLL